MALLSVSQIHEVLAEERAKQAPAGAPVAPKGNELASLLAKHQLTPDDCLDNLRSNMVAGESGAIRQKAVETALKLNGMLQPDSVTSDFSVTINIIDPQFSGENPILIPR